MAPKRYSIYPSPVLDRFFAERLPEGGDEQGLRSRSSLVSAVADRYSEIVRRAMPTLSVPEWCLIFDSLNGCWSLDNAAIAAQCVVLNVADSISLNQYDKKWDVDGPELVDKLQGLRFPELVAILDAAERFWAFFGDRDAENEEIAQTLGLRITQTGEQSCTA